jgi:hypothetical protein
MHRLVKWSIVALGIAVVALIVPLACSTQQTDKHETPAGHPDELKDSTRFDPAPDTTKRQHPVETPE